ncbi:hypothetical protein Lser_V15G32989 [Lactuca serriola]
MTRYQNHDDNSSSSSSSQKRFKTFDRGGVAFLSDLHHDVLFLVMMRLGFIDFFSFSGVCKSWRSFALANMNRFMASKPPMSIRIDHYPDNKKTLHLKDFEGRKFKTSIPHSAWRRCVGCTCGYLVLMGRDTHDFWLVNPITRHELYFTDHPLYVGVVDHLVTIRPILVFLPSISRRVFVMLHRKESSYRRSERTRKGKISFSIEGKQGWNHVSSTLPIIGLQYFKGKIYTLHIDFSVRELRIYPNRKYKWTLLETNNFPDPDLFFQTNNFPKPDLFWPELVSSGENLYVIDRFAPNEVLELDIGEMKWVSPEKTIGEYAVFLNSCGSSVAIKPESWVGPRTQYKSYDKFLVTDRSRVHDIDLNSMWYFPHDCFSVNLLDDQ